MLAGVTSALTQVIAWIGTVLTAITGESGALADLWPLLAIGNADFCCNCSYLLKTQIFYVNINKNKKIAVPRTAIFFT